MLSGARLSDSAGSARRRRVIWLLAAVWLLNIFDLEFTVRAHELGSFTELNPLAAGMLSMPWSYLAAFKFISVGVGTLILMCLSRHHIAELGSWLLVAAYVFVAARWYQYYAYMLEESSIVCFR
jgi:hypothetical protein